MGLQLPQRLRRTFATTSPFSPGVRSCSEPLARLLVASAPLPRTYSAYPMGHPRVNARPATHLFLEETPDSVWHRIAMGAAVFSKV